MFQIRKSRPSALRNSFDSSSNLKQTYLETPDVWKLITGKKNFKHDIQCIGRMFKFLKIHGCDIFRKKIWTMQGTSWGSNAQYELFNSWSSDEKSMSWIWRLKWIHFSNAFQTEAYAVTYIICWLFAFLIEKSSIQQPTFRLKYRKF